VWHFSARGGKKDDAANFLPRIKEEKKKQLWAGRRGRGLLGVLGPK
jgi:hypothetical protein